MTTILYAVAIMVAWFIVAVLIAVALGTAIRALTEDRTWDE